MAARVSGRSVAGGVTIGALGVLGGSVVADRMKWRGMWTGCSWTGNPEEVARAASALAGAGLEVHIEMAERGPLLRYRNRDACVVRRELRQRGYLPST